jgi:uncharacterized repeat protein (TIGR01451 family)
MAGTCEHSGDLLEAYAVRNEICACACDPNDKHVEPLGCGAAGYVPQAQPLTYRVRFQNIGQTPAHNVVIQDVLDADLMPESFRVVSTSHPLTRVELVQDGEAIWTFEGIELPSSSFDEPGSQGDIIYTVVPRAPLAAGTAITNLAAIYFDDNEPVITNTTRNTIAVDGDADGRLDPCDNCPLVRNPAQSDTDHDGRGNACDNCLVAENFGQEDADGDGAGDACDCAPNDPRLRVPREVLDLRLASSGGTTLTWSQEPLALAYSLTRGSLSALTLDHYGDCLARDVNTETYVDPSTPAAGDGYCYLVRAVGACGSGSLGWGYDGERVNTDAGACP